MNARTRRHGRWFRRGWAVAMAAALALALGAEAGDHRRAGGYDRFGGAVTDPRRDTAAHLDAVWSETALRSSGLLADGVAFDATHTTIGDVGLTISNFSFFGNNFNVRAPSFEYPLGAQVEHMVRGGVWVGAIRADTGDTLVSTGTADGRVGDDTDAATEWRPTSGISRRSILINNRHFSPEAISEQDLVTSYADTVPIDRTNAEDHRPLGLEITQRVFGWSFDPANSFIIVEVQVTNINPDVDLFDVYVGMYAELASGFKGRYEDWPPGGEWFDRKVLDFDPERWLVIEHHVTFDNGEALQYGAIGLLGTRPAPVETFDRAFRWWPWDPGNQQRDQDIEKYGVLSVPGFDDVTIIRLEDDPAELLAVGPWPLLAPGDTVTVAFAFVGAAGVVDAQEKFDWARTAFDRNYVVPLPPPSPRLFADARPTGVTIRWDSSPELVEDPASGRIDFEGYRVYVSRGETDDRGIIWNQIAEADVPGDTLGFNTGFDHLRDPFTAPDGTPYDYRFDVKGLKDGHKYWVSVTAFDFGDTATATPPLESGLSQNRTALIPGAEADPEGRRRVTVYPNPYRGRAGWDGQTERERVIWFGNLPPHAAIRIYTLAGDWVATVDFDSATYHGVNAPGVYDPAASEDQPVLSGGVAAWDLLSWNNQPIATGLYLFVVHDRDTGETVSGRFMVLK